MTEGTSQGLFIVVAIVIFGIFVVMAYILFEDTLSPALASMFVDSTEEAMDKLTIEKREYLPIELAEIDNSNPFTLTKDLENNILILDSDGSSGGIKIPSNNFTEIGKTYEMRFQLTLNSGGIDTLGGHLNMNDLEDPTSVEVFVNGKLVPYVEFARLSRWSNGFPLDISVGETIDVTVSFKKIKEDEQYSDNPIKIQPNRHWELGSAGNHGYGKAYNVTIANLEILEKK